jgi:hypothetical protein
VVPIDPVADPEEERRHEKAQPAAGGGNGEGVGHEAGEIEQEGLPAVDDVARQKG